MKMQGKVALVIGGSSGLGRASAEACAEEGAIIVIGDVNPGAEVRAEGSIIVLGRLRGVAHAAIGRDAGFIVGQNIVLDGGALNATI